MKILVGRITCVPVGVTVGVGVCVRVLVAVVVGSGVLVATVSRGGASVFVGGAVGGVPGAAIKGK